MRFSALKDSFTGKAAAALVAGGLLATSFGGASTAQDLVALPAANDAHAEGPQTASAPATKAIADVANMSSKDRILYIYNTASNRVLALGKAHGDAALACLQGEFMGFKKADDGTVVFPRGLKALIGGVHRLNNNGQSAFPADTAIEHGVNTVAKRVCKLPADTVDTAALDLTK